MRAATHQLDPAHLHDLPALVQRDIAEQVEDRLLIALRATRDRVTITWEAHREVDLDRGRGAQPEDPVERLPWHPGEPLPADTVRVYCYVRMR